MWLMSKVSLMIPYLAEESANRFLMIPYVASGQSAK